MFGTTICRPAGYSTFMMEEHNLMPPNITLVQPNSPSDCFRQLADGAVDGVVLSVDVSDDAIRSLGVQPQVKHIRRARLGRDPSCGDVQEQSERAGLPGGAQ